MSHRISIVIACLNEYDELQATIKSIRETAGDKPEVIIVDDFSPVNLSTVDKNCKLIRNSNRAGVGASRHVGALAAAGDFLLITDSHVRFEPGWYEKTLDIIKDRPTTLHCGSCVGLSAGQMDMSKSTSLYSGAYLKLFGEDDNRKGEKQILECCWMQQTDQDDFPMSGIMGASYVVPTDFFFHIGGLRLLKQYGSDEPLLAIKTWLAGGDVRMMKSLRIGHMFREVAHYKTAGWAIIWNKMAVALTTMPEDKAWKLINLFPNNKEVQEAKRRIEDDWNVIQTERAYNLSVFKRDFSWFQSYFKLTCP
jgi:glycosyltransferase involved in cell wall biosynthesis